MSVAKKETGGDLGRKVFARIAQFVSGATVDDAAASENSRTTTEAARRKANLENDDHLKEKRIQKREREGERQKRRDSKREKKKQR